jgi:hypothetical protein
VRGSHQDPDSGRALALCGWFKGSHFFGRAHGKITLDPGRDHVGLFAMLTRSSSGAILIETLLVANMACEYDDLDAHNRRVVVVDMVTS